MASNLFINGKIWQQDGPFKESIGIDVDSFNFVGNNKDTAGLKNKYDNVVDLKGRVVLPGFIDSHVHLVYGSLMRKRIDSRNIKSLEQLSSTVNEYIKKNRIQNDWVIGGNIDINALNLNYDSGNPLDSISENYPLYFINYDYHSALANSAAIKITSLDEKLHEFNSEEIPLLKNGSPSGLLKERAMKHIFNNMPDPSLETKVNAVSDFIKELHKYGITGVCDILITEDIDVYPLLFKDGNPKIRISSYLPILELKNINKYLDKVSDIDKNFFKIKGFKIFYDGSLGSATGLFKENYLNQNQNGLKTEMAGSPILPELLSKADKDGWQLLTHAIGDKAVDGTLTLYENLIATNGLRDRRARIEHAQHIDESDFDRLVSSGVIISAQPVHLKYDASLVKKILPESIVRRTHNYKILIDRGVRICFGTDFPIVGINPFENIQTAGTRKIGNDYFFPENRIDLHNCIKCYTINSAYASFSDNIIGSIEVGKKADFIVLKNDIFSVKEDEIEKIKVEETYFNGEKVYSTSD